MKQHLLKITLMINELLLIKLITVNENKFYLQLNFKGPSKLIL